MLEQLADNIDPGQLMQLVVYSVILLCCLAAIFGSLEGEE